MSEKEVQKTKLAKTIATVTGVGLGTAGVVYVAKKLSARGERKAAKEERKEEARTERRERAREVVAQLKKARPVRTAITRTASRVSALARRAAPKARVAARAVASRVSARTTALKKRTVSRVQEAQLRNYRAAIARYQGYLKKPIYKRYYPQFRQRIADYQAKIKRITG